MRAACTISEILALDELGAKWCQITSNNVLSINPGWASECPDVKNYKWTA